MFREEIDVIYHFTSIKSFEEIINSKIIRLYTPTSDNETELCLSAKEYYEAIKPAIDYFDEDTKKKLEDEYLTFKDKIDDEKKTLRQNTYSFSTTEKITKNHWETYGDKCAGICVGFDRRELEKITCVGLYGELHPICISPMLYSPYDANLTTKWIEWALSSGSPSIENNPLLYLYFNMFCVVKDKEYAHYKEVRIFTTESDVKFLQSSKYSADEIINKYLSDTKLDEAPQSDGDRKYRNLKLSCLWTSNLIPEIRITAKCKVDKKEIEKLLIESGLTNTHIIVDY